jgi:hypothetical protein
VCVPRAKQYVQAWLQPRYGFTVQEKGIADAPGTWFNAEWHVTSWNVMPANSGVVTLRTNPSSRSSPGSAAASVPSTRCPCHLILQEEQKYDGTSSVYRRKIRADGVRADHVLSYDASAGSEAHPRPTQWNGDLPRPRQSSRHARGGDGSAP